MRIHFIMFVILSSFFSSKLHAEEQIKKFCKFAQDIPSDKLLIDTSAFACSEKKKQGLDTEEKSTLGKSFRNSLDFFSDKCKSLDELDAIPGLIQFSARKCISSCKKESISDKEIKSDLCENFCEMKWSKVSLYFVAALNRDKIQMSFRGKKLKQNDSNVVEHIKAIKNTDEGASK